MSTLLEAIDALIEANAALRKRRALAQAERQLAAAMRRAFAVEERAFVSRLAKHKGRFPPAVREVAEPVDWESAFDGAADATARAFLKPIDDLTARALLSGMLGAVADLSIETSFTLEHPAAVEFLRDRGAAQVTRIRETTRETLRAILSQAAEEGWGYDKTATAIRRRYRHFGKERARNIAVFELGDAYEHGNVLVAKDLQAGGLEMQKQWLSVGDALVRPEHRSNQAQGWIDLDAAFQSGHDRPPTDPRCRCTLLMRRKPSE
jgi:hypothetical protein